MTDICRWTNNNIDTEICMYIFVDKTCDRRRYNGVIQTDVFKPQREGNLTICVRSNGVRHMSSVLRLSLAYTLLFSNSKFGWQSSTEHVRGHSNYLGEWPWFSGVLLIRSRFVHSLDSYSIPHKFYSLTKKSKWFIDTVGKLNIEIFVFTFMKEFNGLNQFMDIRSLYT